jgi:hypothetical protein
MTEKHALGEAGLLLADLEGSQNEILARIARELQDGSNDGTLSSHSSHSSSSGSGHYSYTSATGPSKAQTSDEKIP